MPIHHLCHGLSLGLSVAGAIRRSRQENESQVRTVVIGPQPGPGVVATTAPTLATVPYQAMDANPNDYRHYNASGAKITGIIQMVSGCISALIGIALIIIVPITPSFIAAGIWGGALFFISGVIGIYAASRRQNGLIVSYLVLSIISAAVAGIAGAFYMQSAISVVYRIEQVSILPLSEYIGFSAALAAVLFIECIAAAMASGVGCCGLCCTPVDNNLTNNQMIVQANHPYGFYTNDPAPMVQGQTLGLVPNTFIPVAQPGGQIPGPGPNSTVVTVPINA